MAETARGGVVEVVVESPGVVVVVGSTVSTDGPCGFVVLDDGPVVVDGSELLGAASVGLGVDDESEAGVVVGEAEVVVVGASSATATMLPSGLTARSADETSMTAVARRVAVRRRAAVWRRVIDVAADLPVSRLMSGASSCAGRHVSVRNRSRAHEQAPARAQPSATVPGHTAHVEDGRARPAHAGRRHFDVHVRAGDRRVHRSRT